MNILKLSSWIFFIIVFVGLALFSNVVHFITDWWWFSEMGFSQVFLKSLGAKIGLFTGTTVFAFLFLFLNLWLAIRSKLPWVTMLPQALMGQTVSLDSRIVKKLAIAFSLVMGLFLGMAVVANWQEVLKYSQASEFGILDPIFGKDIGFYLFSLPVFKVGLNLVNMLIFLSLSGSVLVYFLRGKFNIKSEARTHLGMLLAVFLVLTAVGSYLSIFGLLVSQSDPVFGAVYTDVAIRVPLIRALVFTALLSAVSALYWGFRGKLSPLVGAFSLYLLAGLSMVVIPSVVDKLVVAPNQLVKETPYIKYNIKATNQAFGLDKIEERDILGEKEITAKDIANNDLTVKNVRLWDRQPLLSTFSQIQEIRTYYEFAEVDDDRYIIDGEIRQIMLSPREMASASLPNRNWINERLTFTHGYGVAGGPVNLATPEGLPVLFVQDLPPKATVKELEITRPEIYFGELSNEYVITNTKSLEFDYPKGDENVYANYEGTGGVEINSLLRRIFYALRFKSLKLLLSNDITNESRVLYYRNIVERVAKIAPFLTFDQDPYIVIADGKIYWIVDAYTTSNLYPYSQPLRLNNGNVNYIRNSVKVVVDAYNGKVSFYQADSEDPVINTYAKIFPNTFKPLSEIPESLVPHLRYPEDIFTLQTAIYNVYHMNDPQIFYNKEDQWEIPAITTEVDGSGADKAPRMSPRHIIMKLPGEEIEEFILMLPFTPRAKDNLSAWMVARSDGKNYGQLVIYRFPKDKLIFGPKQIIGRINQNPEISRQISLWDQRGSQVIQGPLLVIPIEESLIYVRPLYLKADAGKIPELKRVIVAYDNRIAMEETLEAGLAKIFGSGTGENQVVERVVVDLTPEQAIEAYEEALRAQREGDWARYGEAIRRLGEILRQ